MAERRHGSCSKTEGKKCRTVSQTESAAKEERDRRLAVPQLVKKPFDKLSRLLGRVAEFVFSRWSYTEVCD